MASTVDLIQEIESSGMDSPVSDFTEENFEEQLGGGVMLGSGPDSIGVSYPALVSNNDGFYETPSSLMDIHRHAIVDVIGDDKLGRKIITVYACRLPNSKEIDHGRLLQ